MTILDIINNKRLKKELTREEIKFAVNGYVDGSVKDYQMSSLLMAILLNGMSFDETFYLTNEMLNSGDRIETACMSWYEAVQLCNKLSVMNGLTPCYAIGGNTDVDTWEKKPKENDVTFWNSIT